MAGLLLLLFPACSPLLLPSSEEYDPVEASLLAWTGPDAVTLVWNNYQLPYLDNPGASNPDSYQVLMSDQGAASLVEVAQTAQQSLKIQGLTPGKSYWFAVESRFSDGETRRSNIVMASPGSVASAILETSAAGFAANRITLASGTILVQGQSPDMRWTLAFQGQTPLTTGRDAAAHPNLDQFAFVTDLDDQIAFPQPNNFLATWHIADSSYVILSSGYDFIRRPNWDAAGDRLVFLGAASPTEAAEVRILLTSAALPNISNFVVGKQDEYTGAGTPGPDFPSFHPTKNAVVMDLPSFETGALGRNIHLINLENQLDTVLVSSPWRDTQPSIHPSGNTMLFVSDRSGIDAIWQLDLISKELRQITGGESDPVPSRDYPLTWSKSGDSCWFTSFSSGTAQPVELVF